VTPHNFDTDPSGNRGYRLAQAFKFVLGGEEFELRHGLHIGATALDEWFPMLARMNASEEARAEPDYKPVDDDEFITVWRQAMRNIVVGGEDEVRGKLDAILDPDRLDPLMFRDAIDVILWAVPVVTGARPTEASPASSDGSTAPKQERAATSSTADSSSPVAEELPI
jgi:hypothetical protein